MPKKDQKDNEVVYIYGDKERNYIKHPINYKHVFQIWANHVYKEEGEEPLLTPEDRLTQV